MATNNEQTKTKKPKRYKLVIVGDGGCGKTSLLTVFKTGSFPTNEYLPTVFDTDVKYMTVDGKDIELTLWDTAGQEIYDRLRQLSYPSADVVLICFAIDRPETLDNVRNNWAPEVQHFCKDVPVVLVGNKIDLRSDPQVLDNLSKCGKTPVRMDQMRNMADHIRAMAYHECSAKYNEGVSSLFATAARAAMARSHRRRRRRRRRRRHFRPDQRSRPFEPSNRHYNNQNHAGSSSSSFSCRHWCSSDCCDSCDIL